MISRRNFLSICTMMAVIFFMFQFSQVVREDRNSYGQNIYISNEVASGSDRWHADDVQNLHGAGQNYVTLLTEGGSSIENMVSWWCEYTKRGLVVYRSIEELEISEENPPEAVLVDSKIVYLPHGMPVFDALTEQGITLIFCNLPSTDVIRGSADLRQLLGIQSVREDSIETEGIHLFGGFFLGGESYYRVEKEDDIKLQDLELVIPWYIADGGTKTYMVGMLNELLEHEEAKNEYFPGIIWRNGYNGAMVFVVNGDYMESMMGIGILDAMMYEANSYLIYPVINAQNITVANFPGFARENDDKMQELYSRDAEGVLQEICWPALSGMARRSQYRMTCLMAAQYDYIDDVEPSANAFSFYLQQFREINAEAGLSLIYSKDTELSRKLDSDEAFYSSLDSDYIYGAAYAEEKDLEVLESVKSEHKLLENVRTIASDTWDNSPVVAYFDDDITLQSVTAEAPDHKYSDNIKLKCFETALGYSNVLVDMHKILWPESEDDRWENASESMVSNLDTYWRPFSRFDKTTLSESDARIRNFLNLDYEDEREENKIQLNMYGTDEGWFLLRTHGERISTLEGGEYRRVEEDAYLIHAMQPRVEISLEKERGVPIYSIE